MGFVPGSPRACDANRPGEVRGSSRAGWLAFSPPVTPESLLAALRWAENAYVGNGDGDGNGDNHGCQGRMQRNNPVLDSGPGTRADGADRADTSTWSTGTGTGTAGTDGRGHGGCGDPESKVRVQVTLQQHKTLPKQQQNGRQLGQAEAIAVKVNGLKFRR